MALFSTLLADRHNTIMVLLFYAELPNRYFLFESRLKKNC